MKPNNSESPNPGNLSAAANKLNSMHSTGPKTPAGKQRVRMNAFKHGLTGQYIMLEDGEMDVYVSLTRNLTAHFLPADELELQLVQKIVDGHMRLNRLSALVGNAFKIALVDNLTTASHDDQTEAMTAAVRGASDRIDVLLKFARYEAHLTRGTLRFQKELRTIQTERRALAQESKPTQPASRPEPAPPVDPPPITPDNFDLALFCKTPLKPYGFVNLNPLPLETPARTTPRASQLPAQEVKGSDFKG